MKSIRDDFWGRFVDRNILGAKTPRVDGAYVVTAREFGAAGRKPPITANTLFTRELYEKCPIDPDWSHGSLEDYEWFWRVVAGGHRVLVSDELFGWHHHRAGFRALIGEYRRSARGCAYFIGAHWDAPFARRRLAQAIVLPGMAGAVISSLGCAAMAGNGRLADLTVLALAAGCALVLSAREFARTRTLESLLYPLPALVLGTHYTISLVTHLVRGTFMRTITTPRWSPPATAGARRSGAGPDGPGPLRRLAFLLHPLTAILVLQAACSLSLIWSNTAFGDEADYLWIGHLVVSHWLHGTSWAQAYAQGSLSGSPVIYPPIAAAADALGGLAGARALSMCFMLVATWLLYSSAARLLGRRAALFAAALFALSEPALRLAFATYDPLSVMLTALSGWAAVRALRPGHRGEFIALAGLALALANASAYSTIAVDPVVLLFAVIAWRSDVGLRKALRLAGWLAGAWALCLLAAMSVSGSWGGLVSTLFNRAAFGDTQSPLLIIDNVWGYSGFILVLAVAAAALAPGAPAGTRRALLVMLGLTGFVVPLAQLQEQTGWSLDKHVAYGIWFASMAAGYALGAAFTAVAAGHRRYAAAAAAVVVLAYPGYSAWQSAWISFHGWANSASYVAAIKPLLATTPGTVYTDDTYLAQYYTPEGHDWSRWSVPRGFPSLATPGVSQATWDAAVRSSGFGVIVLFYPAPLSPPGLARDVLAGNAGTASGQRLLQQAGASAGQPGLAAATLAVQADRAYKLVAVGPDSSRSSSGIYAIWRKEHP
jgi:hypothetical protein